MEKSSNTDFNQTFLYCLQICQTLLWLNTCDDEATAVWTAPAISGWIAARICATREEVDNDEEEDDDEEEEEEDEEDENEDDELDDEEEEDEVMIWIALFTWLSHTSCKD